MATLQIAERRTGEVVILDLWGQITIGETSETLRTQIKQLIDSGQLKVVLQMGGIYQVDSSGLGSLVAVYSSVKRHGGELKLVQISEAMKNLMIVTKLLTVFDVHQSEATALASFQPDHL